MGLHTLNLSGTERCTSIAAFELFTFLIYTTANEMSERCGTAVSQSLLALTALRVLDLSSTAHRTLCTVLEHNVAVSNTFHREPDEFVSAWLGSCRPCSKNSRPIADGAHRIADAAIMP